MVWLIDTPSNTPSVPLALSAGVPGWFQEGNPGVTPYTVTSADWGNMVQGEIYNVALWGAQTPTKGVNNQMVGAITNMCAVKLLANTTLNVSTTGNDATGNGSSAAPFASIQGAWNHMCTYFNLNGFSVTIQVAAGNYTGTAVLAGCPTGVSGGIEILGNAGTPNACVLTANTAGQNVITMESGNLNVVVNGFYLQYTGGATGSGNTVSAQSGGILTLNNITFGACVSTGYNVIAATGTQIIVGNGCSIAAGVTGAGFMRGFVGGDIFLIATSLPGGSSISYSSGFACVDDCGTISSAGTSFSGYGSYSGARYTATLNGTINTSGSGANYFPGSTGGSTSSGGQYS